MGQPRRPCPADAHPRARGHPLCGPHHAGLDDRGPRKRLRGDGALERPAGTRRHHPPRPPERARPDLPGYRPQPRISRRRNHRRRIRLQLRRHRRRVEGRGLQPRPARHPGPGDADRRPVRRAQPPGRHRDDHGHPEVEDSPVSVVNPLVSNEPPLIQSKRPAGVILGALGLGRTRIGLGLVLIIAAIAIFGPLIAPHGPADFIGLPNTGPTGAARFGTDHLGQDVWSRFLDGGREILLLASAATLLGLAIGTSFGLLAAYSRGALDDILMRSMDVILAFPSIMLALVAIATLGASGWLIILAVGLTNIAVALLTMGTGMVGDGIARAAAGIDRVRAE